MTCFAGIDSGSWTTKAVVVDADAHVLGAAVLRSGADLLDAAAAAYALALERAQRESRDVAAVWSTGFGRQAVTFANGSRTELDCHGRGAAHYVTGPIVIIDIGGQDAKVIRLDAAGRRLSHRMNRKCAAGTGSFLDEMALRLGTPVETLDALAAGSTETLELSSFCTVFAGTELLTLIRSGKRSPDLAMAAYRSLAKRVLALDVLQGTVVATGGVVAHHPAMVRLLEEALNTPIVVPPHPQEMGAFGAALAARDGARGVGTDATHEAPRAPTQTANVPAESPSGLARHARAAVRLGDTLTSRTESPGRLESVGSMLARNASRFSARTAFAYAHGDRFESCSWERLLVDVVAMGRFLTDSGVAAGDRVVAVAPNRHELLIVELAAMCVGAIYVPIFAGYSTEQIQGLIDAAEPRAVAVVNAGAAARLRLSGKVRALLTLDDERKRTPVRGPARTSFRSAIARYALEGSGDARIPPFLAAAASVDPHQPCMMMYTSGTSGALKGVLLTHDNILSQRRAISALWNLTPSDRFLSYLPWHHSFGGIFEKYGALYNGATLAIDDSLGKDFPRLLRNWLIIRPTVYFSVPKVYQELVAHAQAHPEHEARIFHPELRFVFTAAAPLPANISRFFAERRIPVVEGWGLTETAPCCTLTDPAEPRSMDGMVGYPIPGVAVRVAQDGEILVRGPNVMHGYFKDLAATAAAIDSDGWFHTGDLGTLEGRALRLVSRKDRIFKMLNAEKIVPTELENRLAGMNRYIRHVIVAGEGRGSLTALIFPDFFRIAEEFRNERAAAERVVKQSLCETIAAFNRGHPVKYERIAAVAIVPKELTIEDGELTPSLKVRVRRVLDAAEPYLDAVYEPAPGSDCRLLRQVMRMHGDSRPCFSGLDRTLDHCHECGNIIFGTVDMPSAAGTVT